MVRRFREPRLVIASHNEGKVREIRDLLAGRGIEVTSAAFHGVPEPEETGTSFAENAVLKAQATADFTQLPALADDSGLEVPALGGQPGIRSARWAGPGRDFAHAMRKVHEALGKGDPAARFICALALAWPDGHAEVFEGTVEGTLVWPPRGTRGFGYDPVFLPRGGAETFGEMAPEEKHAISHRADAFRRLVASCFA